MILHGAAMAFSSRGGALLPEFGPALPGELSAPSRPPESYVKAVIQDLTGLFAYLANLDNYPQMIKNLRYYPLSPTARLS